MSIDSVPPSSMTGVTPTDDSPGEDFADIGSARDSFIESFIELADPYTENVQFTDFQDRLTAHLGVDSSEFQQALHLDGSESPTEVANRYFDALTQFNDDQGLFDSEYPDLNSLKALDDPRAFTSWAVDNYTPPVSAGDAHVEPPAEAEAITDTNLPEDSSSGIETPDQALQRIDTLSDEIRDIETIIDDKNKELSDIDTELDKLDDQIEQAEADGNDALAAELEEDHDKLSSDQNKLKKEIDDLIGDLADKKDEGSTILFDLLSGEYKNTEGTFDLENLDLSNIPPEFLSSVVLDTYSSLLIDRDLLTDQIEKIDNDIAEVEGQLAEATPEEEMELEKLLDDLKSSRATLNVDLVDINFSIEQLEEVIPEEFLQTDSDSDQGFNDFLGGEGNFMSLISGIINQILSLLSGKDLDHLDPP